MRPASLARRPSAKNTAPSSVSASALSATGNQLCLFLCIAEQLCGRIQSLCRADSNE